MPLQCSLKQTRTWLDGCRPSGIHFLSGTGSAALKMSDSGSDCDQDVLLLDL